MEEKKKGKKGKMQTRTYTEQELRTWFSAMRQKNPNSLCSDYLRYAEEEMMEGEERLEVFFEGRE